MIRIHKEGHSFLLVLFLLLIGINLVIYFLNTSQLIKDIILVYTLLGFLFFVQFFRSPQIKRNININKVISPANGKVVFIGEAYEDEFFKEKKLMISMAPFTFVIDGVVPAGHLI